MTSLKNQALLSAFWSFFETFSNRGLQFVVGIILARMLLPEDFGVVAVLALFMGIAGVLVESGFKISIIRTKGLTDIDCSTIFYVNLLVSVVVGLIVFLSASTIASFFDKPELEKVTMAFALIPVINGFGLVQAALIFKSLNFRRNAKVAIIANVIAGGVAIILAYKGFSYWALVWKTIIVAAIYNGMLWLTSTWRPKFLFSLSVLKKHFRFSSKLLMTGIVDSFLNNIYSFIFGKYFTFSELGYFTKGSSFSDMITKTISASIEKVMAPVLAASYQDTSKLISIYNQLLRATTMLIFPLIAILIVVANPMILFLLGERWLPAVPFLQILALASITYPVINANSSLFGILGRSDIILNITMISRPIQIVILVITVFLGPHIVAVGILIHRIFTLSLSIYFVRTLVRAPLGAMFKIYLPATAISLTVGTLIFIMGLCSKDQLSPGLMFILQSVCGVIITLIIIKLFRVRELEYIKGLFSSNTS